MCEFILVAFMQRLERKVVLEIENLSEFRNWRQIYPFLANTRDGQKLKRLAQVEGGFKVLNGKMVVGSPRIGCAN